MKRPFPSNQLVSYYGVGGFCKPKGEINDDMYNGIACKNHCAYDNSHVLKEPSENQIAEGSSNMSSYNSSNTDTKSSPTPDVSMQSGCQRMHEHKSPLISNNDKFIPGLKQDQIVIISNNYISISSDESIINVDSVFYSEEHDKKNIFNPWGNMDVNDIPLDIKHNTTCITEPQLPSPYKTEDIMNSSQKLNSHIISQNNYIDSDSNPDDTSDDSNEPMTSQKMNSLVISSPLVTCVQNAPDLYFNPLSDAE